jgi:hypothetical protein
MAKIFFSWATRGFYDTDIHSEIPQDAVEITNEHRWELINGQSAGRLIVVNSSGVPVLADPPQPTTEHVVAALTGAVQSHLDTVARSYGYDNAWTACTYADEPAVPRFQQEGASIRAWRSAVWAACHTVMDTVQAGHLPVPTAEELISGLPELVIPT